MDVFGKNFVNGRQVIRRLRKGFAMAEAAEITPSEDSLLTEKLSIGKVEYDVSLTSNVLRFTKNVGKGKPPVHR